MRHFMKVVHSSCVRLAAPPRLHDLRALAFVELLGAIPIEMEAERHDTVVATISHLPYLLSAALVSTAANQAES